MFQLYKLRLLLLVLLISAFGAVKAQINTPAGAVVPFGANQSYAYGIMPTNLPTTGTYGKSQDAADAYNEWKANYVVSCGAGISRVKFDDPSRTVSEGIGYGMLLSAYAADQTLFNELYAFYKARSNGNGFMNWRVDGCTSISGTNGATDADLDVAYALLVASEQWPSATTPYNYKNEASTLVSKIKQFEIHPSSFQANNGDGWGFGNTCRNPSYQSPAYYKAFASKFPADVNFWNNAVTGGYGLVNNNAHGTTGLISDWSDNNGTRNTCNGSPIGVPTDGYGYDACRNPWRMAQDVLWNNDASAKSICTKIGTYVSGKGASGVRGPLYQDGTAYSGNQHNATFVSTFAVAIMGTTSTNQTLMNQMYTEVKNTKDPIQNVTLSGYFGNTLRCLSLFMMTGNFWKLGTTSQAEINVRVSTTDVIHTGTYDFQNVISTGNKVVTFTIENKGFQTLNLTGTPKVTVTGTDAANFTLNASTVPGILGFNATTTFTITFAPGGTGTKTATVTIPNNDSDEGPYTFTITGTGTQFATAPKISVLNGTTGINNNGSYNFGTVTTTAAGWVDLTIKNTGDAPLNISSITIAAPFSFLAPAPTTVAVGGTATLTLKYSPTVAGASSGSVTINNDDATNGAFKINLSGTGGTCSAAIAANDVLQDFDGNRNITNPFQPAGTLTTTYTNPDRTGLNASPTVAQYIRLATGTYDVIRYTPCGTNFQLTTAKPTITILFYSPKPGVTVTLSAKKAGSPNPLPIFADYSSDITVKTTKSNQWEKLVFDLTKVVPQTSVFTVMDLMIDPLGANVATAADRTYMFDDIRYAANPCLTDLPTSEIFKDFDTHNNVNLEYAVASLTENVANPSATGINTSSLVGKFVKSGTAAAYSDGFRYDGCGGTIDLSGKTIISMMFYSPVAGVPLQMNMKKADGPDADTYLDDVGSVTTKSVQANQWHKVYFDFTAYKGNTSAIAFDIFIDPTASLGGATYYFDEIRYDTDPCLGLATSTILMDYENNRFLKTVFASTGSTFNDVAVNSNAVAPNTSALVGQFVRSATGNYANVRLTPCSGTFDLSLGKSMLTMQVYSPNANVPVVVDLKTAAGTTILQSFDTIKTAGWSTVTMDFSDATGTTNAAFIDIAIDPMAVNVGTVASRTYLIDNIKYAAAAPEISVAQAATTIKDAGNYDFGSFTIGTTTAAPVSFTIKNLGLQDVTLTGGAASAITIVGPNAADFTVDVSQTTTPIGAGSATAFTITFNPTSGGIKTAYVNIANNDGNENPYNFTITGTALAPEINLKQGTTNYLSGGTPYAFGSVAVGSSSTVITFTIENLGNSALNLSGTPKIAVTGANASEFTVNQTLTTSPVGALNSTTFTVTFSPTTAGAKTATLSIINDDANENPYTIALTGTGTSSPEINVKATTSIASAGTYTFTSVTAGTSGTPVTFTIENTGNAVLNLTGTPKIAISGTDAASFTVNQSTTTATVAATTGTTTFTVTFSPATAGIKTAVLTIANDDSDEGTYTINLSGTATAALTPEINVKETTSYASGSTYTFTSVAASTSGTAVTFTIENTGTAALNLTGTPKIAISGTDASSFTVNQTATTSPVAASTGTTTFTITFTPATVGAKAAIITIANNDADEGTYTINLAGTATAAPTPEINVKQGATSIASAGTYTFTSVAATTSGTAVTFTIENIGSAALNLTGTPKIAISGTDASSFTVNQTATTSPVASPTGTTTFTVTFSPATAGAKSAVITIANNDSDEGTYTINLAGTATAAPSPEIDVKQGATSIASAGTYTFTSVAATTSGSAVTFTIENTGPVALNLTGTPKVAITGADASSFVINQASTTSPVAATTGTTTFTITFSPTTAGAKSAVITIANNDADEGTYTINLAGTATAAPAPEINVKQGTTNIATAGNYSFTSVTAGTSGTAVTFTIENTGSAGLALTGTPKIAISGTDASSFTVDQTTTTASVAAAGTTTFTVTFTPATAGAKSAIITIANNDSDEGSYVINLSGTATAPLTAEINVKVGTTNYANNSSYTFSSVVAGTSGTAVTFTVENLGGAALNLTGTPKVAISGTDAASFVVDQTTTTATVAAAGTTTFTVTFSPATVGNKSATITIANNDSDEGSYVINFTGTATAAPAPEMNVKVGSTSYATNGTYNFTSVAANSSGTAVTFTVENIGTASLTLSGTPKVSLTGTDAASFVINQTATTASVAAAGTTTFTITFSPTTAGAKTATISIANNDSDENPYVINLTGTALPPPSPEINVKVAGTSYATASTYTFASAVAGASGSPVSFTIENTGSAPLTLNGTPKVAISGADASSFVINQTTTTGTVAAAGTTTFIITFTPATAGAKTASISISNDDSDENPYVINLSGTATAAPTPEIDITVATVSKASGSTYDFGTITTGSSTSAVTFTIQNSGSASLSLTGSPKVAISGIDATSFVINQSTTQATVASGASTVFAITFTPTSSGAKTATISISNNDSDENPYTIVLTGNATASANPECDILITNSPSASGSTYNFGQLQNGSAGTPVTFTIQNTGIGNLNLTGTPLINLVGSNTSDFIIDQTAVTSTIAGGSSVTFTVTFSPTSLGLKSATLTILNNDGNESNYTINLQGVVVTSLNSMTATSVSVYPNPAQSEVFITAEGVNDGEATVVLRDNLGVVIKEFNTNAVSGRINVSLELADIAAGMYVVEISNTTGKLYQKVIKE